MGRRTSRGGSGSCSAVIRNVQATEARDVQERSETFTDVQGRSEMRDTSKSGVTKPPKCPLLSPRQLAAARWLVKGFSTVKVAGQLETTVQTINRWRRTDIFRREMLRLHEILARQELREPTQSHSPAPPMRRESAYDRVSRMLQSIPPPLSENREKEYS
jgi:hypothetical protein